MENLLRMKILLREHTYLSKYLGKRDWTGRKQPLYLRGDNVVVIMTKTGWENIWFPAPNALVKKR